MALVDFRRNFGSPLLRPDTDLSSVNSYIFLSNLGLHESTVGVAFSHIYSGENTSELMATFLHAESAFRARDHVRPRRQWGPGHDHVNCEEFQ